VNQAVDANVKNGFGRLAFEEALQGGHGGIADIVAPRTKLDDDKMYYSDAGGSDQDGEEINDEDLFGDEEDLQA